MPHFAVILWETEVTNVGALKLLINAINSVDKHSLHDDEGVIYLLNLHSDLHEEKVSKYIVQI